MLVINLLRILERIDMVSKDAPFTVLLKIS
ncbi:hypothetical protein Goarm_020426 [Gossypium armourianum]|uniref:Uncharacterized protein n=1 Tax=Gossypium armourianum TaxID=34283 RepID=A0A7J9IQ14_9ROSI|nr:hypothetical protein [Gossypium armourianum]